MKMPATATNTLQKTTVQDLRSSFATETLNEISVMKRRERL